MANIKENFKELRKELGKKQQEMADELGVSKEYISKVERGVLTPSFNLICKYNTAYNVSADYLITGQGQKYILPDNHILNTITEEQHELLNALSTFEEEPRAHLMAAIREMILAAKKTGNK
ncbi:MAG: helix-turn-helix domain-containing protein [bacterium]|nr:helix-turn-helix domain-containing protein [bacterium]